MEFTNKPPQWDNAGTEPTTEEKQQGWAVEDKVPAPYLNWFWNLVSKCISELQTKLHNEETNRITAETETTNQITEHINDMNSPHVETITVTSTWMDDETLDNCYVIDKVKRYHVNMGGRAIGELVSMAYDDTDVGLIICQWMTYNGWEMYREYTVSGGGFSEWKRLNVIDTELSETSENAVQNKVVTAEIDNIKANINALPKTGAESGTIATCIKENKTETVAIDANNPYYVYPEEGYGQYVIEFENTPAATYPVIIHLTTGASLLLYKDKSPLYVSDTKVVIPVPLDDGAIDRIVISDDTANTVTVTATSSIFAEVKDGSITADKLSSDFIDAIQMKPTYTAYTISASGWTGDTAPYTYTIEGFDGKTVNIYEDGALATAEQLSALASANIKGSPTSEENILYAFGEKPTIDIPVALGVQ